MTSQFLINTGVFRFLCQSDKNMLGISSPGLSFPKKSMNFFYQLSDQVSFTTYKEREDKPNKVEQKIIDQSKKLNE